MRVFGTIKHEHSPYPFEINGYSVIVDENKEPLVIWKGNIDALLESILSDKAVEWLVGWRRQGESLVDTLNRMIEQKADGWPHLTNSAKAKIEAYKAPK